MTTMTELLREVQLDEEKDLVRGLKSRHIQRIAIGGAIGIALFLGSARAIQAARPALLLSYALVGIVIAHLGYRKAVVEGLAEPSLFRMPGSPVTNWISLAFIVLVTCFLALDADTRIALIVGPIWFAILALGYRLTKSREPALA